MAESVLIVDDCASMRKILMRGHHQAALENAVFADEGDGIERLVATTAAKFDLILADVRLPSTNGLDFAEAVCEKLSAAPPITMITTNSREAGQETRTTSCTNGCLEQPYPTVTGPFLG